MNFQALHFSSEEDSDDSSVDSYGSSDEEGGMVGGTSTATVNGTQQLYGKIKNMIIEIFKTMTSSEFEVEFTEFWKGLDFEVENIHGNSKSLRKYPVLISHENYKTNHPNKFRFAILFHENSFVSDVKTFLNGVLNHHINDLGEIQVINGENTIGMGERYYNGLNINFMINGKETELRFHTSKTFTFKEIPNHDLEYFMGGIKKHEYRFEGGDNYFPDNIVKREILFLKDHLDHMKNAISGDNKSNDGNPSPESIDFLRLITEPSDKTNNSENVDISKDKNYKRIPVPGDGNCFFYSMIQALKTVGIFTTVKELREIVANMIDADKYNTYVIKNVVDNDMDKEVLKDEETLKTFIKKHEKKNVFDRLFWADENSINTIEKNMNLKFIIINEEYNIEFGSNDLVFTSGINPDYYILLFFFTQRHYELMTYKGKSALTFEEIPHNLKMKIKGQDTSKSSIFSKIPEFKPLYDITPIMSTQLLDQLYLKNHPYKTILYFLILNHGSDLLLNNTFTEDFTKFKILYDQYNPKKENDQRGNYEQIMTNAITLYMGYNINTLTKFKGYGYNDFFKRYYINNSIAIRESVDAPEGAAQEVHNRNPVYKGSVPVDFKMDMGSLNVYFDSKNIEIATPRDVEYSTKPFNPLPGLIDFDRILNGFMNAREHQHREHQQNPPIKMTPKYQHIPPARFEYSYEYRKDPERLNDEYKNYKNIQKDYIVYEQHVNERVYQLDELMTTYKSIKVTIAGDANGDKISLGTGLAKNQWIEQGYTYEQYRQFMDHLHQSLKGLKKKYNDRVVYGLVSGSGASATHYHVWGANESNWDLKHNVQITGEGQARAMKTMGAGVFGIVTTPLFGKPELKESAEEKTNEYDIFTADLKELAKAFQNVTKSLNEFMQTDDYTRPMTKENAAAEENTKKIDIEIKKHEEKLLLQNNKPFIRNGFESISVHPNTLPSVHSSVNQIEKKLSSQKRSLAKEKKAE